ncbi:354L [Invertebrate iridescent virus Kaz2018]|uniref:354L n=1 Tax=Invertebrate iridescent virus 6 TaxID=176652 RepID=Q91FH0_IIV6|nr:354L [Invertebrate iridescent virus 6]AAK82215.1 354L [Invertebrate iridescent virus 6]QMS79548.1 hypothetical protein IIV6-T1_347 [Invertebrate iridescent virus 6]QNH08764.1 354L [Invertebrate iridescent virus Kaz2018]
MVQHKLMCCLNPKIYFSFITLFTDSYDVLGGGVAEWVKRWHGNPKVPGSNPGETRNFSQATFPCFGWTR